MSPTRIATTRAQDLQPLGTAGQTAVTAWTALSSLLERALSSDHAALLAEPVTNPVNGEIDWYADGTGEAVPLPDLGPEIRAVCRAQWQKMRGDILGLADRMRASRDEGERVYADMLGIAITVPDESFVRVRNGRLVLVAWGHLRAGQSREAAPVELRAETRRPGGPMTILPPPTLAGPRGPGAAWVLATVLATLLLAAAAFTVWRDPFGWYRLEAAACHLAPGELDLRDRLRAEEARGDSLREQRARLTQDAGDRRLQCPPAPLPAPIPAPVPAPTPVPPRSADANRASEHGAQGGKVQIILAWDDINDLDLYVRCPNGHELIYYKHRTACGGTLDVDANGDARTATTTPVENVYFPEPPPPGRYVVLVDPFAMRPGAGATSAFRLTIRREGQPDQVIRGTARLDQHLREVTTLEVPAP
ncbi:MAG: hypothetical protein P4M00_24945 [Azospirillaceae bacterium]|nr:hypothetical protein [Azospirillaceae bacterium]